jgi:hypothetical protein
MNQFIYWGVVLAGAITLLIEAHRNFKDSLTAIPFKEHPILRDVEVDKLCTAGEKNIGFAFYSLLYLATYILVLSSTEVFELLSNAAQSSTEIGPTDALVGQENDPLNLTGAGYGKPIFISAAIIALVSSKALRPIEGTIRSLSHRLAGIPRGVYAVIEALHSIPFNELANKDDPTLLELMFQADFLNKRQDVVELGHHGKQIATIREALLTIDNLAPAITGQLREQYFPFTHLDAMSDLSGKLEEQINHLKAMMSGPIDGKDATISELFDAAMTTANDTIALFAVHFIRNNRGIKNYKRSPSMERVHNEIGLDYQVELNSFGMSMLLSIVAAIGFGFLVVLTWQKWELQITPERIGAEIFTKLEKDAATVNDAVAKDAAMVFAEGCQQSPPDDAVFDRPRAKAEGAEETLPAQLAGTQKTACHKEWDRALGKAYNERRYSTIVFVFTEIIPVFLAIALAALPAILGREVRKEDNSWPAWNLRRIPFLRLFATSLVPAILAVIGVAFGAFIFHWISAGFYLTESQMTYFFETRGLYFLMHAGLGMIVSIGILVLSDQHDGLYNEVTAIVGLVIGIIAMAYYSVIILIGYPPAFYRPPPAEAPPWFTFYMRETLRYGSCAMFFLFFYAVFVEMTEDQTKERRSWFGSLFGRKTGQTEGAAQ